MGDRGVAGEASFEGAAALVNAAVSSYEWIAVMKKLSVEIWSDVACPWCWVGKRRFEAALKTFDRAAVDVRWRAFELDRSAPRRIDSDGSYAGRLAKKYGMSIANAEARIADLTSVGAADGLTFRFDRIQPGNTFDAHRVIHLAYERGIQDAMKERLLRGYFTDGEPIGEPEALVRLATDAGLDADEVHAVLASDAHAAAVREDEQLAREAGIHGVPFFLVGRYAISGAQPTEVFTRALALAADELAPVAVDAVDAEACGPDGCAVPAE